MEAYNSLQSFLPVKQQPSSLEASHLRMRGIQYQMYTVSEAHPEYPVHQRYPEYNQQEDVSCWYNMEYHPDYLQS